MTDPEINNLIASYGIVSDQVDARELRVILRQFAETLSRAQGAVVEFGCYRGTTSLYLRRALNVVAEDRPLHVYDSFEGLPDKAVQDSSPVGEQFRKGELSVSKKEFITEFKKAGLRLPIIHKGWFNELMDTDVPEPIAFAFLDGDYYESIRDSLRLIERKLAPGATIIVDDYANVALPGAARALDEWARARNLDVRTVQSLGIVRI